MGKTTKGTKNFDGALEDVFELLPPSVLEITADEATSEDLPAVVQKEEVATKDDAEEEEDFQTARATHIRVLDTADKAIEELFELAVNSDAPRAYEVLSKLLRDTAEISASLNNLKKERKVNKTEVTNNQQNNFFVGSTAELQKMLKEARKGNG